MQTGSWRVLGLMSGSSLDGVDMCLCEFHFDGQKWHFNIEHAHTEPYPPVLADRLRLAHEARVDEVQALDTSLGMFFAEAVAEFLQHTPQPMLISSHGHTVLHQPESGYTLQIGGASHLAARMRLPVVYDFRSADVALGGQGAPLVPVGDALLFGEYAACLNLGGIANVSLAILGKRYAWDMAFCNMVFNHFSEQLGFAYDHGGALAASGNYVPALADELQHWAYYQKKAPKSLGREDFERSLLPLLQRHNLHPRDVMHTYSHHLAQQMGRELAAHIAQGKVLVSGGGAWNHYLIAQLKRHTSVDIEIPNAEVVEQKEALIFAFLGLLRYLHQPNVYSEVTGSSHNHSAGVLMELFT